MSSCTCTVLPQSGFTRLIITGRIDSMSAPELQQQFEELILGGSRLIVADLEQVNFISSAGLRVFLIAQKELTRVGGEIILFKAAESVTRVFAMSGFHLLLKIIASEKELAAA
jgi:anti-anti-sigma factor